MKQYLIPIIAYAAVAPIIDYFAKGYGYLAKILVVALILGYFWKDYKEIKIKFDFLAILIGAVIFLIWISVESFYPKIMEEAVFNPTIFNIIIRLIGSIFIASIVEELFTRSFLMRAFIDPKNWEKVKIGTYTLFSFIITVLFFGFAHSRWLVGLATGIILNLFLYKRKDIFSCIQAHAWANLILGIYIIITNSWFFW